MNEWIQILLTGGLFTLIEFFVKRHDEKKKDKTVLRSECHKREKQYEQYFASDKETLDKLTQIVEKNTKAITVLLYNDTVVLEHLETNNATHKISKRKDATNKFLVELLGTKE